MPYYYEVNSQNVASGFDNTNNEGYQIDFSYKDDKASFNLRKSFIKIDMAIVDNNNKPYTFGDTMVINEMPQHALFKSVRVKTDDIDHTSSSNYYNQCFTHHVMKKSKIANVNISPPLTYDIADVSTGKLVSYIGRETYENGSSFQNVTSTNHHALLADKLVSFGSRMSPFPIEGDEQGGANLGSDQLTDSIFYKIRNLPSIMRNKRQFLFGSNSIGTSDVDTFDNRTINTCSYIMQPAHNDLFESDYLTNNIEISLTRAKTNLMIQYPNYEYYVNSDPDNLSVFARGLKVIIYNIKLYVYKYDTIIPNPRQIVYFSALKTFNITSSGMNINNALQGHYDYAVLSIVHNGAMNGQSSVIHPCQSGVVFNQDSASPSPDAYKTDGFYRSIMSNLATQLPELTVKTLQFSVKYKDGDIVKHPRNFPYNLLSIDGTHKNDYSMAYLEYLKACNVDPFHADEDNVAKIDYMTFMSQLFYMPVSLRKDGEYKTSRDSEENSLDIELNLLPDGFISGLYNLVLVGFYKKYI